MNAPEINADLVAKRKLEEERVAFLRACAIAFVGSSPVHAQTLDVVWFGNRIGADALIACWSAIFEAIEATRSR